MFSPKFSYGVVGGCVLEGVINHSKALKLRLPRNQRKLLTEGP